jgi:hypothetical protein
MFSLILALALQLQPPTESIAAFRINLDVNEGVDAVVYVGDLRIQPGRLYIVEDIKKSLPLKAKAIYYDYNKRITKEFLFDLVPDQVMTLTITIRAVPAETALCMR